MTSARSNRVNASLTFSPTISCMFPPREHGFLCWGPAGAVAPRGHPMPCTPKAKGRAQAPQELAGPGGGCSGDQRQGKEGRRAVGPRCGDLGKGRDVEGKGKIGRNQGMASLGDVSRWKTREVSAGDGGRWAGISSQFSSKRLQNKCGNRSYHDLLGYLCFRGGKEGINNGKHMNKYFI